MHPEDWGQVEAIFDEALRLAPSEREAFVRAECGSDDALYSDIMPLLRSHGERSLLDESAGNLVASWLLGNVPAPRTGEQIGPYEILAEIGQGGMGAVYRAKDTRLHRDVALKFVRDVDPDDSERFRSFEQEAHAASGLNHPNVVTVYDIGATNGMRFIACEFVDGVTLRQRLSAGRMEVDEIVAVASQVAAALAAAHRAGILHCDIKPDNIMIRRDGLVKVLDFGVAKLTTEGTAGNTVKVTGTPRYMAPEHR